MSSTGSGIPSSHRSAYLPMVASSSAMGSVLDRIARAVSGLIDLLAGAFGRALMEIAGRQGRRRRQSDQGEGS